MVNGKRIYSMGMECTFVLKKRVKASSYETDIKENGIKAKEKVSGFIITLMDQFIRGSG